MDRKEKILRYARLSLKEGRGITEEEAQELKKIGSEMAPMTPSQIIEEAQKLIMSGDVNFKQ